MKKYLQFIIKGLVSGILLFFICLKIDWNQFVTSFLKGNYLCIVFAMMIGVLFNIVKFTKWYFLINLEKKGYSFWDSAKSYMLGNCLGIVTPMRAGDLSRALYFPPGARTEIMSLTVIDRLMELAVVFLLAITGSFILINKAFGLLMMLMALIIFFVLLKPSFSILFLQKLPVGRFISNKLKIILDLYDSLDHKTLAGCLVLSFFAFILVIFEFYVLVIAFEDISMTAIFLIAPLITISNIIPISIMGLGVREGLSIILLANYGVSEATGLSAAFLLFLINNISISLIGIIFLSRVKIFNKSQTINDNLQKIRA